eukprot:c42906_g1_i1 orf=1-192(-)
MGHLCNVMCCQHQKCLNGGHADCGDKGLIKVNSWTLRTTLSNQPIMCIPKLLLALYIHIYLDES